MITKTITYYEDGTPDEYLSKAWAWRIGNRELCWGKFFGKPPTFFYLKINGTLHPGSLTTTLRIGKLMIGLRKYDQ